MYPRDLYPPVEPYWTDTFSVDHIHTLYVEQSGNPLGAPVIFLHGGPGGGSSPIHRRFFDPARYRIIVFDQRGAGRSTPLGETRNNNIALLVQDIETIRERLDITRWHVFGGSWGSTLALAYAQAHPQACLSLTLRGIFLMRQFEVDWFMGGVRHVFPEAWRKFSEFVPAEDRHDLLRAYAGSLDSPDPQARLAAARTWSMYEASFSCLLPNEDMVKSFGEESTAIGLARMEVHYFLNEVMEGERGLLKGIDKIRHIPAIIVQGRYDMVCPIRTADELHCAWPEADYVIVPDAGHSAMEPGLRTALITATDRFASLPR